VYKLLLFSLLIAASLPLAAQKYGQALWVEVSKEIVPAGGTAQLQVFLTEPKPIIRTRLHLEFDQELVADVVSSAVYSLSGDAVGTVTRRGNRLIVEAASPSAELGWIAEYPIVTFNVRLRANVEPGQVVKFEVLPESEFYRRDGSRWQVERYFTGGITVGGQLGVDRLQPSGGLVRAGQVVKVFGRGFREDTRLQIEDVPDVEYRYLSETEMELVAPHDFQLDQQELLVTNPENAEKEIYAAFEGSEREPSVWDTVSSAVPLFSHKLAKSASFRLPAATDGFDSFAAVALQNPHEDSAPVDIALLSPEGNRLAEARLTLLPGERLTRDLTELFPIQAAPEGSRLQVESARPIQVVGLCGEHNRAEIRSIPLDPAR
jgi:hypothetical protein